MSTIMLGVPLTGVLISITALGSRVVTLGIAIKAIPICQPRPWNGQTLT
jgi:hypothetical protein